MGLANEVLLVDDQADVRLMVGLFLRRRGLAVREAGGGLAAVEAYRTEFGERWSPEEDRT